MPDFSFHRRNALPHILKRYEGMPFKLFFKATPIQYMVLLTERGNAIPPHLLYDHSLPLSRSRSRSRCRSCSPSPPPSQEYMFVKNMSTVSRGLYMGS